MTHTINAECTGCTACVKICPVNAIHGERKSLHVIIEDNCIDCGACGRICPFAAVVDPQGEICTQVTHSLWPQPAVLELRCVACGACIEVCPTSVLNFVERVNGNTHLMAALADEKNCIGCSFCATACPTEAILMVTPLPT